MTEEMLAGEARIEGEEQLPGPLQREIAALKAKYRDQAPKAPSRGIYSKHANDWAGAVMEFVPTKAGKVKHGKLLKVSDPGTEQARALLAWLFVEDLTHSEVESMTTVDWPYPDHRCTVIQQPRVGAA
jgi:hypothetical protein